MGSRRRIRVLLWLTCTLVLITAFLAGCAEVQVIDTTPAAEVEIAGNVPAVQGKHDLAVMTVEFDPPLSYQQLIARRQSVSLLVVVENKGNATERVVVVQARLTSPQNSDLSIVQEAQIDSIAPGEIQIVRFGRLGDIPYHKTYRLEVSVNPVGGEVDRGNNRKAFEIQIHRD